MADPGFPGQHTTTTTTTTVVDTAIRFDNAYIRILPGILKIVEIILNFLGFICISVSGISFHSRGEFFNFVAGTGFWFTGILLVFYLFHIIEKFHRIPWLKIELGFCGLWTLFYLIASCLAVSFPSEAYNVGGFFGFCAMVAYGLDCFLKLKAIQNGEIAQGIKTVNTKQISTVSSPA